MKLAAFVTADHTEGNDTITADSDRVDVMPPQQLWH